MKLKKGINNKSINLIVLYMKKHLKIQRQEKITIWEKGSLNFIHRLRHLAQFYKIC
jgi:hypothetical protein